MLSLYTSCTRNIKLIAKSDVSQTFVDLMVVHIRPDHWSDSLVIRKSNFEKKIIASDSLWGYQDEKGLKYRYFNNKFYKLIANDLVYVYSQYHSFHHKGHRQAHYCYYFSLDSNSEILDFEIRNFKLKFMNNPCFVESLASELNWYHEYNRLVRRNGKYPLTAFYKKCK